MEVGLLALVWKDSRFIKTIYRIEILIHKDYVSEKLLIQGLTGACLRQNAKVSDLPLFYFSFSLHLSFSFFFLLKSFFFFFFFHALKSSYSVPKKFLAMQNGLRRL